MDSAEIYDYSQVPQTDSHADSRTDRTSEWQRKPQGGTQLVRDIDDLRRKMAETFLKEASFTADPVIMISRQLDLKINEYMMQWTTGRKKAR
ncbi:aspartyl-phosphate phosphatase Spo0E family protein [Cohnella candidum]|uniref:Aspartyl-phosphate phosphatase Spo0E family protein n=1 Tax=Cohnella candidum TaxID=2674991 RepID=A0A3G3JZM4_9BACL|nr:aspartyl-phosphate phosphatase Spo0E family protein [Cohnella candidum]AYQ73592.1 aspartyl-phosphate phosphatase Spo0E family protein [Cohnella candidum]